MLSIKHQPTITNNPIVCQIIINSPPTESVKNSYTESVDYLTTALTPTTKAKLNLATNSKVWDSVDTEINVISVMT